MGNVTALSSAWHCGGLETLNTHIPLNLSNVSDLPQFTDTQLIYLVKRFCWYIISQFYYKSWVVHIGSSSLVALCIWAIVQSYPRQVLESLPTNIKNIILDSRSRLWQSRPIHWPLFVLGRNPPQYKKRPMYWSSGKAVFWLLCLIFSSYQPMIGSRRLSHRDYLKAIYLQWTVTRFIPNVTPGIWLIWLITQ